MCDKYIHCNLICSRKKHHPMINILWVNLSCLGFEVQLSWAQLATRVQLYNRKIVYSRLFLCPKTSRSFPAALGSHKAGSWRQWLKAPLSVMELFFNLWLLEQYNHNVCHLNICEWEGNGKSTALVSLEHYLLFTTLEEATMVLLRNTKYTTCS